MLGTILLVFAFVLLVLAAFNCPAPPALEPWVGWNGVLGAIDPDWRIAH